MSGRSKLLTYGLPVVGAAAFAWGVYLVATGRPVSAEESPPRLPAMSPSASGASGTAGDEYIGAIGVTEPAGEAIAIAASASGVVTSVSVSVGDAVSAGDVLLVVDERLVRSAVALAASEVATWESEVDRLRALVGPRAAAVRSAEAGLSSAEAGLSAARADAEDRANRLRVAESVTDKRAIASEEVARRRFASMQADARVSVGEAGVLEAEALLAERRADLGLLVDGEGEDGPEVRSAVARVAQAEARLGEARTALALRTVRSPVAGRVLQVNVRVGEFASASVPTEGLVVLGRSGLPELRVEIDEVDIARFSRDAQAWASPRGDASTRLALEPAYVEPLVVPKSNLSGRTSERVDTRVMQVVYRFAEGLEVMGIGQQFDVFVAMATGGAE